MQKEFGGLLGQRLQSSALLVAAVALCIGLDVGYPLRGAAGVWLMPLLVFFAAATAVEVARLAAAAGQRVRVATAVAGAAVVVLSAFVPLAWQLAGADYPEDCPVGRLGWPLIGALLAIATGLGVEMARWRQGESGSEAGAVVARVVAVTFVALYVGLPMALLAALRQFGTTGYGMMALVMLVATTKASDIGAYATGKLIGRHKLIPRVSPGKTWEGVVGGVVAAIAVAWMIQQSVFQAWGAAGAEAGVARPLLGAVLFGLSCAGAGIFGDLCESLIKRDAGAKDSGTMLPGMGGAWDVTDSVLGAALPGYLLFSAGVVG